mgnify:CR=1 FL=1
MAVAPDGAPLLVEKDNGTIVVKVKAKNQSAFDGRLDLVDIDGWAGADLLAVASGAGVDDDQRHLRERLLALQQQQQRRQQAAAIGAGPARDRDGRQQVQCPIVSARVKMERHDALFTRLPCVHVTVATRSRRWRR